MPPSADSISARQGDDDSHITRNSLASLDTNNSRHSSLQGPYREGISESSFPVCTIVESPTSLPQTYARSLLPLGHGFGMYKPEGIYSRPQEHLLGKSALLGGVGQLNKNGLFDFSFNIFFPSDHPIQGGGMPQNFSPVPPSLSADETTLAPSYLSPGTVISSEGIKVSRKSTAPLNVEFETTAREGAVLVLPKGADREELVDPSKLYSYVKDNAISWYQNLNGHNGEETAYGLVNGCLCIIIGIDRVESWATAVFPQRKADGTAVKRNHLQFKYIDGQARTPWKDDGKYIVQYQSKTLPEGTSGIVFLRLMTVALSPSEWTRYIAYTLPEALPRYPIPAAPKSELQQRLQRFISHFMTISSDEEYMKECFFHPSLTLLHVMLLTRPSAKIGIVTDSMWLSQITGSKNTLTFPEVVNFILNVLTNSGVVNSDGVLILVAKDKADTVVDQVQLKKRGVLPQFMGRILPWIVKPKKSNTPAIIQNVYKVLNPNPL